MTPREARETIAQDIRAAMPDGWTVYATPPETLSAPAVVLGPGDPYLLASSFCAFTLQLEATVLVSRAAGEDGADALDEAIGIVCAALMSGSAMTAPDAVRNVGRTLDVGGAQMLTAAVSLSAQIE